MSDETKLMEGEIIAEENLQSQKTPNNPPANENVTKKIPAINPQQIKNKLSNFKKPKIFSVIVLLLLIFTSLIALVVLSSRPPEEQIVDPDIFITSPHPTPQISGEMKEINTKLDAYQKKVEGLGDSIDKYPPPRVDLDIKF